MIKELKKIVGPSNVTNALEDLYCYSYDGTMLEYQPEAVVFPGSAEEVGSIMRLAYEKSIPVVPRGAGTGMTGGSLPVAGGLVMAMSRLDRILEIDSENRIGVVEPGVITGQFQEEVRRKGLFYPPDPASKGFCTIGGNVAECAGGPSAVKYGVTRDYVLGLEVVLPNGEIMVTGVRTAKGVVGYDLTRLFVGSEGTLGVITKIILKLMACPTAKRTFLVLCSSLHRATTLVSEILSVHLPCTLEYMDRTAIRIVSQSFPYELEPGTEAMLLVELDGDSESVKSQAKKMSDFLAKQSDLLAVKESQNQAEADALWQARRSISPAAFQLKPHKMSEDVVVPSTRISDLVDFIERLGEELEIVIFTFGHAGDGNIHVNIMLDREDPEEVRRCEIAKRRLFKHVIELSGTLSGEHGIGITKAGYLPLELDKNSLEMMRRIKTLFDPKNIMNPGKIFPREAVAKKKN